MAKYEKLTISHSEMAYTGESQSPGVSGFDLNVMDFDGTYWAANADNYTSSFSLKNSDNTWDDDTNDTVILNWKIVENRRIILWQTRNL